jgi:hypothetical protein
MSETEEDVFAGAFEPDEPAEPAPAPAPEPAPEPEPETPQEPAPEPAPTPEPEPAKVEAREPGYVPIASMLDEREKRQRAEAELQSLRAQHQPQQVPDSYSDPEGYNNYVQQQIAASQWAALTTVSLTMAQEKHGPEVVKEAADAFLAEATQKPWLNDELRSQPHPYDYAVKRYQQQQVLAKVPLAEVDQFLAWKAAQSPTPPPPDALPAPTPITPTPRPPQSLASAPSAGSLSTVAPEDPFMAEFKRKG